jgi:hypothetical protein
VICSRCHGEGAYTREESTSGENWRSYALITVPCSCRAELPARKGEAKWWGTEQVYAADVQIPIGNERASISVSAEVPYDAKNFRVERRGNRYWPTLVNVESPADMTLHPETARELAQALLAAANAADAIDQADCAPCGHWWPCDCAAVTR